MTTSKRTPAEQAEFMFNEHMAIQPHERVVIVYDEDTPMEMVTALHESARKNGCEYALMLQPSRPPEKKNFLNPAIEIGLEQTDVLIGITRSSGAPIYSSKLAELMKKKTIRGMSLNMRDLDTLLAGGATAELSALQADGEKLAEIWSQSKVMHITSGAGTDISAPIASDMAIIECGDATKFGFMAGLPDGEVSSRPLEGTAKGVFVVDGPCTVLGKPKSPIKITVDEGKVVNIEGDSPEAEQLREIVAKVENADNVAEFGVGVNPDSRAEANFQEVKKRRGQVHIAIGDNIYYGGTKKSNIHMDLVLTDPTVYFDDRLVVDQGILILS